MCDTPVVKHNSGVWTRYVWAMGKQNCSGFDSVITGPFIRASELILKYKWECIILIALHFINGATLCLVCGSVPRQLCNKQFKPLNFLEAIKVVKVVSENPNEVGRVVEGRLLLTRLSTTRY